MKNLCWFFVLLAFSNVHSVNNVSVATLANTSNIPKIQYNSEKNEIDWCENRYLTWADFKGVPDACSDYAALSAVYLEAKHSCTDGNFNYMVYTRFVKGLSWCRSPSPRLLEHEQVHFDMTEVYARKLRKYLHELDDPCLYSKEEMSQIVNTIYDDMEEAHFLYDLETFHGLKSEKQENWAMMVDKVLKNLSAYQCFSGSNL